VTLPPPSSTARPHLSHTHTHDAIKAPWVGDCERARAREREKKKERDKERERERDTEKPRTHSPQEPYSARVLSTKEPWSIRGFSAKEAYGTRETSGASRDDDASPQVADALYSLQYDSNALQHRLSHMASKFGLVKIVI